MNMNRTIRSYWKDWAGMVYLFICLVDFFFAPLTWNLKMEEFCQKEQAKDRVCSVTRWEPMTLQMGGMFHMSFAAILGVAGWKKKEEMEVEHKANNGSNS